ncbi:uncharacterized protein LOC128195044 [Vigna angularis]|uniref:uncharacterized protein LOC128195044 n=1 Tax=Phaseolus angularis TaxID=3914 RepID=UPI0022B3FF69|nr:uncharacterized protein LOC128195044 [Vigna angularis]
MYDVTTNLEDHIKTFTNRITFHTWKDAIWCRAFSLSLEGEGLEWFNSLPLNTIKNFERLKRMFGQQFAGNQAQDLTVFALVNPKKEKEESFRAFMDRLELFVDSICQRALMTMEELRERAEEVIRVEEMKEVWGEQGACRQGQLCRHSVLEDVPTDVGRSDCALKRANSGLRRKTSGYLGVRGASYPPRDRSGERRLAGRYLLVEVNTSYNVLLSTMF